MRVKTPLGGIAISYLVLVGMVAVALFGPTSRAHYVDQVGMWLIAGAMPVTLGLAGLAGAAFGRADGAEDGTGRGGSYYLAGVIAAVAALLVVLLIIATRVLANAMIFSGAGAR